MCKVPSVGEFLDPAGFTRGGQAAPYADPAGLSRGGRGEDPLGLSEAWKDMTGQTARAEMERQQEAEEAQALAAQRRSEMERQQAAADAARRLAVSSIRRTRGRASTLLTGPRGLLSGGGVASRELLAG